MAAVTLSLSAPYVAIANAETPRERACRPDRVAAGLMGGQIWSAGCAVGGTVFSEFCGQANPFPSSGDYWKNCVACLLDIPPTCDENWGDTHVITRDGLRFSFQGQGDFTYVLAENIEVQVRLISASETSVSYFRGIAVRAHDQVVAIPDTLQPQHVWIDGVRHSLASGDWHELAMPGSFVQRIENAVRLELPGIAQFIVFRNRLTLGLDPSLAGKTTGLLGDGDGDPSNDLRTADGTLVSAHDKAALYGPFMRDWRRDGGASLFPEPFVYVGDPDAIGRTVRTLADFSPEQRAAAAQVCMNAGVTADGALDECVYDYLVTGETSHIAGAVDVGFSAENAIAAAAFAPDDQTVFRLADRSEVLPDMPGAGAGKLEPAYNVDRYELTVPAGEAREVRLRAPCEASVSLRTLIRQGETILRDDALTCEHSLKLPAGEVSFAVFSPVGDTTEYRLVVADPEDDDAGATLQFDSEAPAGSRIAVKWTGPAGDQDYITLAQASDPPRQYETYSYLRPESDVVSLNVPGIPGNYEVRYVRYRDRAVLKAEPLVVQKVSATLQAPDSAVVGSTIDVEWTGPANSQDFISLASPGQADGSYLSYSYVDAETNTATLPVPGIPGDYEIRYVVNADRQKIAAIPFFATPANATLQAPQSAVIGSTIDVTWTGPANPRDFISLAMPDQADGSYHNYAYISADRNLVTLKVPGVPGDYEIRYIVNTDRQKIAAIPFVATPAAATLQAPGSAATGSTIEVKWTGPANPRDFISLARPDQTDSAYQTYAYVSAETDAVTLRVPDVPGDYEIRYVVNTDRQRIATIPFVAAPAGLEE